MKELGLLEIMPIESMKDRKVVHIYDRILVEKLNAQRLRDLYANCNFKNLPNVMELEKFFLITYYPKPPIFISKDDGRLYAPKGTWPMAEIQHQASLVMRVLSTYSLVLEHKRISKRKRK